ncbi:uncharacterized protein PV06_03031 [Exophiala oligosperma]|uniref:Store-operated calcium entry-associated regulatory factor n=1 Tax=Exophiala oligosperma TaxID=215243 RepID=A0A0D2AXP1_9EURO|nr:uncharacterized protein PV06_03031 [Exophiala oligosperma]KIW44571.1 hypothetical protein PV06_03031 [Exophiala oligosperma]
MRFLLLLTWLFIGAASSARVTNPKKVPRDAVLLSKVSALTVRAGKQTSSRRVPAVPQLLCVGPSKICNLYTVDVMRCTNEGVDYDENNVQWSCKASLPEDFKLGSTDVICEGYESSDDPYVLKGSCGVEYRLLLTEKGEEKYGSSTNFGSGLMDKNTTSGTLISWVFMAVFFIVLFIIIRGFWMAWRDQTPHRRRPRGGGYGGFGGGGGGDDDPPPPYDPRPPRPKKPAFTSSSSAGSSSTRPAQPRQEEGWRPGFWTGTAAGATAAYLASRGTQTAPQPPRRDNGWFGRRRDDDWFGGGNNNNNGQGGWFGGGNRAAAPPRQSSWGSGTESASPSTTRHTSTGFGGTSRR